MRIFLSWSGAQSKAVASALHDWLRRVVQAFDPWMSDRDLDAGVPWFNEIAEELEKARAGVLCVTPVSLNAPWFMFEAGALAKHVRRDRACPYLLEVEKTQVQGPLAGLQLTLADKADTWRLVESLHNVLRGDLPDRALSDADLRESFDTRWPALQEKLEEARGIEQAKTPKPDTTAMQQETLLLVRDIARYVGEQGLEASRIGLTEMGLASGNPYVAMLAKMVDRLPKAQAGALGLTSSEKAEIVRRAVRQRTAREQAESFASRSDAGEDEDK